MKNMKLVKRIGCATLALSLLLAGCGGGGGGKDAKTIYDEAVKKNAELTSMDMASTAGIKMSQGDETVEVSVKMDVKMDGINTDSMHYLADMSVSTEGQDVPMNVFYTDGYYYMEVAGQKMKYAMDLEKLMEQVKSSTQTLDSASLKEVSAKKDGDNQVITYTADPAKMTEYAKSTLDSVASQLGSMDGMEMNIKEAKGTMTVNKDGYMTVQNVSMTMDLTMQGETVTMEITSDTTVNNPGQEVTVTLPEATDDYIEVDPAALGL